MSDPSIIFALPAALVLLLGTFLQAMQALGQLRRLGVVLAKGSPLTWLRVLFHTWEPLSTDPDWEIEQEYRIVQGWFWLELGSLLAVMSVSASAV